MFKIRINCQESKYRKQIRQKICLEFYLGVTIMDKDLDAFFEEVIRLKRELDAKEKLDCKEKQEGKEKQDNNEKQDLILPEDKQLTEEEFLAVMSNHCKDEKKRTCPYCKKHNVVKYGFTKSKKQRYKCKDCIKYYCITTNTPMYYSKKTTKEWFGYYKLICTMAPLRKSAKDLGISVGTAFQWRHKILNAMIPMLEGKKEGTIEIDEVLIPESFKGNHSKNLSFQMGRPEVKGKRTASQYIFSSKVSILCCKDRQENVFARTGFRGKIPYSRLYSLLADKVSEKSVLCTTNNRGYIPLAKRLNCKLYKLRGRSEVVGGKYHIKNAGAFGKGIVNTINHKFKGVATKYLNFYLSWFHWQESSKRKTNSKKLEDILRIQQI